MPRKDTAVDIISEAATGASYKAGTTRYSSQPTSINHVRIKRSCLPGDRGVNFLKRID